MGQVVNFSNLNYTEFSQGVKCGQINNHEIHLMMAELFVMQPNSNLSLSVPIGSDRYFYTLTGDLKIGTTAATQRMPKDTFTVIQENTPISIENQSSNVVELLSVISPPENYRGQKYPGFADTIKVLPRNEQAVVEIPDQKKQRIYFVGKENAKSERAHAMIVVYQHDTVTGMHMHPNAESMFILLTGKTNFTVNGQDFILERGNATVFPMGDRHGLKVAEGDGVSFLEFHLPAAFTSVRG